LEQLLEVLRWNDDVITHDLLGMGIANIRYICVVKRSLNNPKIIQLKDFMAPDILTLTWFKCVVQAGVETAIPVD
jgi:hypothetical protein